MRTILRANGRLQSPRTNLVFSSHRTEAQAGSPISIQFRARWKYLQTFLRKTLDEFYVSKENEVLVIAHTMQHMDYPDLKVTLIPVTHFAHPQFFLEVDSLCSQHHSVLMEGRSPVKDAPYSTIVAPRARETALRPVDFSDSEGWEPAEISQFWQPFSWGVRDSPQYTVVHAADVYDIEKIPIFASQKKIPVLLSRALDREKHCLSMLPQLYQMGYKTFAIPWGAAHMPYMYEMLLDSGFEEVSQSGIVVFRSVDGEVSRSYVDIAARSKRRRDSFLTLWTILFSLFVARIVVAIYPAIEVTAPDSSAIQAGDWDPFEEHKSVLPSWLHFTKNSTTSLPKHTAEK